MEELIEKKSDFIMPEIRIKKTIPNALLFFFLSTFLTLILNVVDKNIFSTVLINEALCFLFFMPNVNGKENATFLNGYVLKFLVLLIMYSASVFLFNANIFSIIFTTVSCGLLYLYLLLMQDMDDWVIATFSPVYIVFVVEFLNGNAVKFLKACFVDKSSIIFTLSILFVWALTNVFAVFFKKRTASYLITAFISFIFGFLNKFSLICTQKIFSFSNVKELWNAMKITGFDTYKKYIPVWLLILMLIIIYSLFINILLSKEKEVAPVIRVAFAFVGLIICLIYILIIKKIPGESVYGTTLFDVIKISLL